MPGGNIVHNMPSRHLHERLALHPPNKRTASDRGSSKSPTKIDPMPSANDTLHMMACTVVVISDKEGGD